MTDKIIIDGVDVSGCEQYKQAFTGFICSDPTTSNDCSKNQNCLFKQLARIQNQYNAVVAQNKQLQQELKAEWQKVEKLEKINKELVEIIDGTTSVPKIWDRERLHYETKSSLNYMTEKTEKYKQALEEIKKIATLISGNDDKPACVDDEDCPLNGGVGFDNHCNERCPFILAKQILQKCEVLDDSI